MCAVRQGKAESVVFFKLISCSKGGLGEVVGNKLHTKEGALT